MSNNYNANIYLTTNDLNNVEERIEELTEDIREKVFDNTNAYLRNIQVGDDLGGKTLYLSFPRTSYEDISIEDTVDKIIIVTDSDSRVSYRYYTESDIKGIVVYYKTESSVFMGKYLYACYTTKINPHLNMVRIKLPQGFGKATSVDITNPFYQYVKIYDESVIPNYTKHRWYDGEILTMQKIDNIEQGVKNIGFYYEKPNGWLNEKEWLGINTIYAYAITNYGVGIKTISYQDLNRWYNNLELINFDDLDNMTIWNAKNDITQLSWNEDSDIEWIDVGFAMIISPTMGG